MRRYRGELLRYCRRLGLSDSRAEDALQHALLQAWLAIERGVEVRQLRAWLYRIVHNTALNHVRRFPEDHAPLAEVSGVVESSAGVEGELERAMAVRDTLTDVAALPRMQREAILLSAVDGRSHEEVATVLGVTDGAVRGLLYRARASLRTAAAALTPQPLIGWLYGNAARVAPSAERLAEISAQGGPGASAGGFAFRGVAVALTAAMLAGGAAVGPLRGSTPHRAKARAHTATLARVGGGSALTPVSVGGGGAALLRELPVAARSGRRGGAARHDSGGGSRGSRHRDGHSPVGSGLSGHDGSTGPAGGGQSGDGSSRNDVAERAPRAESESSGDRTRGHGGGDGTQVGSDGSGSGSNPSTPGPGGSTTPQPVSSSGDGSGGTIATTAGSESSDPSGSGSGDSSDDRGSHGDEAGSADSGRNDG